jgi:hypothetical protein
MKTGVLIATLCWLGVAAVAAAQQPPGQAAGQAKLPRIDAMDLAKRFQADRANVVAAYARRPVQVDGLFEGFSRNDDGVGALKVTSRHEHKSFTVVCELKGEDAAKKYSFQHGAKVTFVGTWDGTARLGYYMVFANCKLSTSPTEAAKARAGS